MTTGIFRFNTTVRVQGLHGSLDAPYVIGADDGASVTLDGTLDVPGPWSQIGDGAIWVSDWPADYPDPWQLFVGDEMMVVARWPNARWDNKSMFDDRKWAHGSKHSTYCGSELRDDIYRGPCQIVDGTASQVGDMIYDGGGPDLASSGINATGASAILNVGHWFTFGARVLSHEPGTSNFTYERDGEGGGWKAAKYKPTADLYYLEGALSLLDAETEWHYERTSRKVYLITRGNADPNDATAVGGRVRCRVQEYAIAMMGVSHVVLRNMGFFATTAYAGGEGTSIPKDINNVKFDSLRFVHPSASKRVLGEARFSHPTTLARKKGADSSNNTLFNCSFFGAEAHPLINSAGSGMRFENNLVEWTDWSAVTTRPVAFFDPSITNSIWGKYGSGAMTLEMDRSTLLDAPNWIVRNHIHHSGPSVGLAITSDNVHSRLNRISHQFAIQEDGGLMQMNGLKVDEDPAWGLTNKQNWLHDALVARSTKWGLRFDRANSECYGNPPAGGNTWAYHGNMEKNVVWNCNGVCTADRTRNPWHSLSLFPQPPLQKRLESDPTDDDQRQQPQHLAQHRLRHLASQLRV